MWLRSEYDLDELPEPQERRVLFQHALLPGAIVGTLGGLLSLFLAMATARVLGFGAAAPLELVGAIFWRDAALSQLPSAAAWLGLLVHLGGAVGLATGFALCVPRGGATAVGTVALAMLTGLAFWVTAYWLLIAFLDPLLARSVPGLALLPFCLIFAACLPLVVPVRKVLEAYVLARHRVHQHRATVAR